jgi:uncharacterized protein
MSGVVIFIVYSLMLSIGHLVNIFIESIPFFIKLLATISIEIFLMTYILMPRLKVFLKVDLSKTKGVIIYIRPLF